MQNISSPSSLRTFKMSTEGHFEQFLCETFFSTLRVVFRQAFDENKQSFGCSSLQFAAALFVHSNFSSSALKKKKHMFICQRKGLLQFHLNCYEGLSKTFFL